MFRSEELSPELLSIADEFRDGHDTDVIVYSGDIASAFADQFVEEVIESAESRRAILVLTTLGGGADGAYKIARCLQREYEGFRLAVRTVCKSAGTLIALGARELVMSRTAELGPLDVQLLRPDSLGERISGLTPLEAMTILLRESFTAFEHYFLEVQHRSLGSMTATTAADIAVRMTTGLFQPLYSQLDPLRIGEYQRALAIASEYGRRLASEGQNVAQGAIARLLTGYPAHEFVIDFDETATLFELVSELEPLEQRLLLVLEDSGLVSVDGRRFNSFPREPYFGYLRACETTHEHEQDSQATASPLGDDDEAGVEPPPTGGQPNPPAPRPDVDGPKSVSHATAPDHADSQTPVE